MKIKKIKPNNVDWRFLIIIASLLIFGLFILSSASFVAGEKKFNDPGYYLKEQLLKGVLLGLISFIIFLKIPLDFLKKYSFIFLIFSIGLLVLVFFPKLGLSHSGSTRWLNFGFLTFQPSEILKLSFLIYLASWLASRQNDLQKFGSGMMPFVVIVSIIGILLLMQPNMGTFGIIALSAAATYFIAGGKIRHLAIFALGGLVVFLIFVYLKPYGAERLKTFFSPQDDIKGASYQINQSLTSIGVGGINGVGVNQGLVSNYLPEAIGDSVFAVLAEKLGLIGVSFILLLYFLFAIFSFRIALKNNEYFPKLLTVGITTWIIVQSFINIGAISGIVPLTGVPLPFISYGSSALVVILAGAGIIANASKYTT
ncbi:MAG: putative peptidoglycan glycosyltransferase FtsW [Patescibacteria group bacterium]